MNWETLIGDPTWRWGFVLVGVLLLLAGRRLYWLFVAAAGFVLAVQWLGRVWTGSEVVLFWLALGVGVLGAIAARFVQQIVLILAGLALGGTAAVWFLEGLGIAGGLGYWLILGVLALASAALATWFFNRLLAVLTVLLGAYLIVRAVALQGVPALVALSVLVVVGLGVQLKSRRDDD